MEAATYTYKYNEPAHWKFYIGPSQSVNRGEEHKETRECVVVTGESHDDCETERGGHHQQLGVVKHCGKAGLERRETQLNEVAPALSLPVHLLTYG